MDGLRPIVAANCSHNAHRPVRRTIRGVAINDITALERAVGILIHAGKLMQIGRIDQVREILHSGVISFAKENQMDASAMLAAAYYKTFPDNDSRVIACENLIADLESCQTNFGDSSLHDTKRNDQSVKAIRRPFKTKYDQKLISREHGNADKRTDSVSLTFQVQAAGPPIIGFGCQPRAL